MKDTLNEAQEQELATLIAKYGKVRTLFIPLDEDDENKQAVIFVKKPDKTVRNMVETFVSRSATDKAIEAALKNLRIGGDDLSIVLSNDDAMASLDYAIAELFSVQKATIKKN